MENEVVNHVKLSGYVGMDPEVKSLKNGGVVARFTLATNEDYRNGIGELVKVVNWHRIVLWNKTAKMAETSIRKGTRLILEGRISNKSYNDKDGIKRNYTEIIGEILDLKEREEQQADA